MPKLPRQTPCIDTLGVVLMGRSKETGWDSPIQVSPEQCAPLLHEAKMRTTTIAGIVLLTPLLLGNGGDEIEAIRNAHGNYSITDVSQYADGKTYTIDINYNGNFTQLIFERPHSWTIKNTSKQVTLDESTARSILLSWLERNFTCSQISKIEHAPNSQKDYFAGALMDVLGYDKEYCANRGEDQDPPIK